MAAPSRPPWEKEQRPEADAISRPPWEKQRDSTKSHELERRSGSDGLLDFEFLNESLTTIAEAPTSFHQFQELPRELRENIFELSLPEQRILRLKIVGNSGTHHCGYNRRNDLGNIVSDANYHVRLGSTSINSPLLYVSHEARRVFNRVYRVCIPLSPKRLPTVGGTSPTVDTTDCAPPRLIFSPERDTISICIDDKKEEPHFADFIHDALAYDPQHKGILHLAVADTRFRIVLPKGQFLSPTLQQTKDSSSSDTAYLPSNPGHSNLHSDARAALTSTLKGLKSVRLIHLVKKPREMFSTLMSNFPVPLEELEIPKDLVRVNRAYPLWSSNASYSILPTDPRPVSRYLDLVDCGFDPCYLILAWQVFEAAFNVPPTPSEKIRVLIAIDNDLATIDQASRFRQKEELNLNTRWGEGGYYNKEFPEWKNPDTDEDIEFSKKQNAIGFWSIPLEAFGPVPEASYEWHQWQMTRVCNFKDMEEQIQLGLFHIS